MGIGRRVRERDRSHVPGEAGPSRCLGEVDDVAARDQRVRPVDARVGAGQLEADRIAVRRVVGRGEDQLGDDHCTGRESHLKARGLSLPLEMQVLRVDVVVDGKRRGLAGRPIPIIRDAPDEVPRGGDIGVCHDLCR
jgi:hypothetical protein